MNLMRKRGNHVIFLNCLLIYDVVVFDGMVNY